MHIKYIYFYIRTNNFIYFNHLIRQLSSWAAFHKRKFRRENWEEIVWTCVRSLQFIFVSLQESFHKKWLQFKKGSQIMVSKKIFKEFIR